jgi:mannosyltransferase OCH1-like enzyme
MPKCAQSSQLVPILSKVPVSSWLSDVIRYHVILRYGGVDLDTDTQAIHNFTPLLDRFNSSWTVCQTPWVKPDAKAFIEPIPACESVICAMIAAPPGHPAL